VFAMLLSLMAHTGLKVFKYIFNAIFEYFVSYELANFDIAQVVDK